MNANEQFIVKHYSEDERPTLKGHGFDGLVIGDDRQEAQDFVDYLNTILRQQQAEIEALKYEKSSGVYDIEPVAWIPKGMTLAKPKDLTDCIPLYTHPVKDLEDIDINITWNENSIRDFGKDELAFARAILRKAQEK